MKITKVEPFYTGGGIYLFYGKCDDNYFIAGTFPDCVAIVDSSPWETEEPYDTPLTEEWVNEHLVKWLDNDEVGAFFVKMLLWVKNHEPDGNYAMGELEDYLRIVKGGEQ